MTTDHLKHRARIVGILSMILTTALTDAPIAISSLKSTKHTDSMPLWAFMGSVGSVATTWINVGHVVRDERSIEAGVAGLIIGGVTTGLGIALASGGADAHPGIGWIAVGTGSASLFSSALSLWKGGDTREPKLSFGVGFVEVDGDEVPVLVLNQRF